MGDGDAVDERCRRFDTRCVVDTREPRPHVRVALTGPRPPVAVSEGGGDGDGQTVVASGGRVGGRRGGGWAPAGSTGAVIGRRVVSGGCCHIPE